MWESNEGIHDRNDWLSLGVGIVYLTSAGLGWYGYSQHMAVCWGLSGLRLCKVCLDVVGLVLLYFVFFPAKATPAPTELSGEQ